MSCLYAAFPDKVLEILSLGSIFVTHRTQDLNITIPPFCCNVSEDDRLTIIDRVLAELQDLSVLPQLQDPTLNTAECVTEGHEPKLTASGRSTYIKALLYISFAFTFLFGPLLALTTLTFFHKAENSDSKAERISVKPMVKAVKLVYKFILVVEFSSLVAVITLSVLGNAPLDLICIIIVIFVEGLVLGFLLKKNDNKGRFLFLPEKTTCCKVVSGLQLGVFVWANLATFHFCWLVIGIMINAVWGLTVLLFVFLVIAASVFIVYNYYYMCPNIINWPNLILCTSAVLSVWLIVALVTLAGQSFFGKQTADEVVKTVVLSVVTAFISWILPKIRVGEPEPKKSKDNEGNEQKKSEEDEKEKSGEGNKENDEATELTALTCKR